MKKLIKSSILCFFTVFSLVSCNRVNYEIPDHKVIIEKNEDEKWTESTLSNIVEKIKNKDTFLSFLYSESCSYCQKIEEESIPYILKNKKFKLYAAKVDKDSVTQEEIKEFKNYIKEKIDFFSTKDGFISIKRPITLLIENGNIVRYEIGYTGTLNSWIDTYIE